MHSNKPQQKQG